MKTELEAASLLGPNSDFNMGLVQTAYANGASTRYLESNNITVLAHDNFDCAVYFEANGHGTVLFSPLLVGVIQSYKPRGDSARRELAFERLQACIEVVNQVTGDAVSDMLLAILKVCIYI